MGAFCAALVGFSLRGLPAVVPLPLALLAAAGGGMVWALVPIALKLRRGAHEVITTIMMNYIASALLLYLINDVFGDPTQIGTPRVRTPVVAAAAGVPPMGPLLAQLRVQRCHVEKRNRLLPRGTAD